MNKLKALTKEIVIGVMIIFILSNIISYVRQPELNSNSVPTDVVVLLDGTKYAAKEGKPLLIHFWATWCPACKLEAANIQSVSKDYEVLTIAVNSGEDTAVQAYMNERDLNFRVLNDKESIWARRFKVEAFPTTFIYDAKGQHKFTEVGYTSTAGLLARMKLAE